MSRDVSPPAGLALTFDDGPDPDWTPRLLDLLDRHGARATFFPIAPRAERAPALLKRMRDSGHAIGLHCDEHVRHSERSQAAVAADTERALARLARLGVRPTLWRTPWGDRAPFTRELADAFGLRLAGWTLDTVDWRGDSASSMYARVRRAIGPGGIVLAHDGLGPGARREDPRETLAFVELVLALAARRGWSLVALTGAVDHGRFDGHTAG